MPRIQRHTHGDILAKLPEMARICDGRLPRAADILIVAAGFEDRAQKVGELEGAARSGTRSLCITYPTNVIDNTPAKVALAENLRALGAEHAELEYDRETFRQLLRDHMLAWDVGGRHVVIDVSAMSSYAMFGVLSTFYEMLPDCDVTVVYTEASEYYPSRAEWDAVREGAKGLAGAERAEYFDSQAFQSRGVEHAYESEVFPGRNVGSQPTRVIAIPSFSRERIATMISLATRQYNIRHPDVSWILGNPPDPERNGWRLRAMQELYEVGNDRVLSVSTLEYKDIVRHLEMLWEEHFDSRHLIIATVGSKMQHLGTFLFLWEHREIGLILSEPTGFEANRFSSGSGSTWWIPFGSTSTSKKILAQRGRFELIW